MWDVPIAELRAELRGDPASVGYAAPAAAADDDGVARLINAPTGPGAGSIALARVSKAAFLTWLAGPCFILAGKDAATQAKWDRILSLARAHEGDFDVSVLQRQTAAMQADGLCTPADVAALTTRTGSRAEVLWGADTVVSASRISVALRGDGA